MRIRPALIATLLAFPLASCQNSTTTTSPLVASRSMDVTGPGVVAHVSVGSNDLCLAEGLKPGCDANFSLVADKYSNGTVQGQWEDEFGKDANGNQLGGVHVAINCLVAEPFTVGTYTWPIAWVSGVVTQTTSPDFTVGEGVITVALDRSHNTQSDRFQDLTSFTIPMSAIGVTSCQDRPYLPVYLNKPFTGQVTIWYK